MDKQGVINRDVHAAAKVSLALNLRAQRKTYEEIAHRCGYKSAGAARNAIMRELQRTVVKNVDELRAEELDILDRLQAAIWPMAIPPEDAKDSKGKKKQPNLFAIDRILAISERRAKLLGLDTPINKEGSTTTVVIREVPTGYFGE